LLKSIFRYLIAVKWIDSLAEELGLDDLKPTGEYEIPSSRPTGLDVAEVVRELRNGRAKVVTHGRR